MATLIIDATKINDAATALGMSSAQGMAWFSENAAIITVIAQYVSRHGGVLQEDIEANASPNGPLDPTLVAQVVGLLRVIGRVGVVTL